MTDLSSAGVVSPAGHDALRADIRRLSTMLGQTLAEHGGPELLELVEQVRKASARRPAPRRRRRDRRAARAASTPAPRVALTRAFSQYFQLANIAEQLHRSRELRRLRPADRRPLRLLMQRLAAADLPAGEVEDVLARARAAPGVHRAPHRVVAAVGAGDPAPGRRRRSTVARATSSSPRCVDLLWQTDEIRPGKPTVADEARGDRLVPGAARPQRTVPDLLGEFEREVARGRVHRCPSDARPLVLGCWVGGDRDGNPNVTPPVTREVVGALRRPRAADPPAACVERADPGAVASPRGWSGSPRSCAARWPATGARCPTSTTGASG